MAKFLIVPVIIILGFASIFYVTSVRAKSDEARKEAQELKKSKDEITKLTFVHKLKNSEKSRNDKDKENKGNEDNRDKNSECFNLISDGAKIKKDADYFINATNSGMAANDVELSVNAGAKVWETAALNPHIFGASAQDTTATINGSAMDGRNNIVFASIDDANTVAIANVWGRFKTASDMREILEFDITFNSANKWGDASVDRKIMDLQSIAANALGHVAGLDDISGKSCTNETMYPFSNTGEIQKRDLSLGDIKGIQKLYK